MTDAAGAGGVLGTMTFDVTGAQEGDLPDQPEKGAAPGSTDQLPAPPSRRSLPGGLTAALPPRAMSPCSSI